MPSPSRALEASKTSTKKNSDSKNHLQDEIYTGETPLCRVLILSEDTQILNSLGDNPQLEPTQSSPTTLDAYSLEHELSYDALIIDTSILNTLTNIDFNTFIQPIIFVQTEASQEQQLPYSELSSSSAEYYLLSELTVTKVLQHILKNFKQTKHYQAVKTNEQKLAALVKELKDQQSFLTEVLDHIPNPIFVKDKNLRYLSYNKAFKAYIKEKDWHGKTLLEVEQTVYQNPQAVHKGQSKLLETNSSFSSEYKVVDQDDNEIDILGTVSPFYYHGGKKQGLIGIVQDITTLKATELELAKSLKNQETLNDKLELLNQLSLELSQATHIDNILESVCRKTKTILEANRVSVAFPTDKENYFKIYLFDNQHLGYIEDGKAVQDILGVLSQTMTSKKPHIESNFESDLYKDSMFILSGYQTMMNSPIIVDNEAIAVINAASTVKDAFDTKEQLWLQQITTLISTTLQKQRLLEQTQAALSTREIQAQQLEGLDTLSKKLMLASTHDAICKIVLSELPKLISSEIATFSFPDSNNEFMETYMLSADQKRIQPTGHTWSIKDSRPGDVITQRNIVRINFEGSSDPHVLEALKLGLRSGMGAPLIIEDKVLGTINVVSTDTNAYTAEDEVFMLQVAALTAATLEHKRLLEESQHALVKLVVSEQKFRTLYSSEQRKSTELELLARVQKAIANKLALEQIFDTVIATLRDLVDYKAFAFVRIRDGYTYHKKSQACCYPDIYDNYSSNLDTGIIGRTARSGEAILVKDVTKDSDYISLMDDVVSNIAVPVYSNSIVVGVLMVEHSETLNKADLNLIVKISEQLTIAIENASLYEQTQVALGATKIQAQRLVELNLLSHDLIFAKDCETICTTALNRVTKLIDSELSTFSFLTEDQQHLATFKSSEDGTSLEATGRTWPMKNMSISDAFSKRQLIHSDFENIHYEDCKFLFDLGLKTGLAVPLVTQDKVLGTLNVTSKQKNAYSSEDEAFMLQLASLVASALENNKLFEESQLTLVKLHEHEHRIFELYTAEKRKSKELMLLERVQSAIADKLALEEIFATAVNTIAELLNYKAIAFSEIIDNRLYFRKNRSFGYEGVLTDGFCNLLGQGIIGVSGESHLPILVQDVHSNPYYELLFEDVVSNIAVPIFRNSIIFGVLLVEHTNTLDETDLNLLTKIAEQLSIAVENATLHEQVIEDLNRTQALYEINQILYTTDSVQNSLEVVKSILAKTLKAQWIAINGYDKTAISFTNMSLLTNYDEVTPSNKVCPPDVNISRRVDTLRYWCIENKQPTISEPNDQDPRLSQAIRKIRKERNYGSTIVTPIYDNADKSIPVGTLSAIRTINSADFNQADLNFLVSVSQQLSIAESQQELSKQVKFQAFHDALTALPNRHLFEKRLQEEMDFATNKETNVGLLFLDLDGFKHINDTFGHHIGDQLLKLVGERLDTILREFDTLARMGGDEFAIILSNIASRQEALELASKFLTALETPFILENNPIIVTTSIGLSMFPEDGHTTSTLVKHADIAMYLAKDEGKNGVRAFSPYLADNTKGRLLLENNLRLAVDNQEFTLHYQPQYCLTTGELMGTEALIRWNHPNNGLIQPDDFIPIAEETLLIVTIGNWALHQACQQTARWHKQGHKITISVNVAAPQFIQENFVKTVREALNMSGLDAQYLELEVTEGVVMNNFDLVADKLEELRDLGVSIALDDFGTGFSSLKYLQKLPFDKLKIDRSFIMNIGKTENDQHDKILVKNIMQLATGFDLTVVAEGIETPLQADYLKSLGCQFAQGYYYARPTAAKEVFEIGDGALEA